MYVIKLHNTCVYIMYLCIYIHIYIGCNKDYHYKNTL